jgi:DNA-binding response OmpR family regulator
MTTLLILDRDARVRTALAEAFLARGYHVLRDARGAAGLTLVMVYTPQVVLVAQNLVDMAGLTFAQRLRALPAVAQPALFLLGMDHPAHLMNVDPCGIFPTPLDLAAVLAQVALVAPRDAAPLLGERRVGASMAEGGPDAPTRVLTAGR